METILMERVIRSGRVEERYRYRVSRCPSPKSLRRKGGTLPRKQDQNERSALKRFTRLINANFEAGDLLIGLSYADEHILLMRAQAYGDLNAMNDLAQDQQRRFLRRLKRELAKQGVELRAIAMASDMDGSTGEVVREHHHIIVKGEGFAWHDGAMYVGGKPLEEIWGRGSVNVKIMDNRVDHAALAAYLWRQVRRIPDRKKYSPTRNLRKPELISEKVVFDDTREIQPPKGARLTYRAEHVVGEGQYIRYVVPEKKPRKRGGKKRE